VPQSEGAAGLYEQNVQNQGEKKKIHRSLTDTLEIQQQKPLVAWKD